MARYGLCLGPLKFRLRWVCVWGGGLVTVWKLLFRWGGGWHLNSQASSPSLFSPLLSLFFTHSHRERVFMVSQTFLTLLWEVKGYLEGTDCEKRSQGGYSSVGLQNCVGLRRLNYITGYKKRGGRKQPGFWTPSEETQNPINPEVHWGHSSKGVMDALAAEAKSAKGEAETKSSSSRPRAKPPKKAKRIVYFEVEILNAKTREKLLLLDKVSASVNVWVLMSLSECSVQNAEPYDIKRE